MLFILFPLFRLERVKATPTLYMYCMYNIHACQLYALMYINKFHMFDLRLFHHALAH